MAMPTCSLICLKRSMSMTSTVGRTSFLHAREDQRRLEPVEEQFAVGQAGEIVVHGVVQQALLRVALVGDVGERADDADHLAVGPDDRTRPQPIPQIMAVGGAQAEFLVDSAAPLLEQRVEAGAVAILLERMQQFEPGRRPRLRARRARGRAAASASGLT